MTSRCSNGLVRPDHDESYDGIGGENPLLNLEKYLAACFLPRAKRLG